MRYRILTVLFLLPLFLMSVPQVSAQNASPDVGPPPPPADWWQLALWSCNPTDCSNVEAAYTGSVTTTITGICFNSFVPSAGETATAIDCEDSVLLDTSATTQWTFKSLYIGKAYDMEGVYASAVIYDDDGVPVGGGYAEVWCDGTGSTSQIPPGLC